MYCRSLHVLSLYWSWCALLLVHWFVCFFRVNHQIQMLCVSLTVPFVIMHLQSPARSWNAGDLNLQLILTSQNLFIMKQAAFFLAFIIFPAISIDYNDTSAYFVTLKSKNNVFWEQVLLYLSHASLKREASQHSSAAPVGKPLTTLIISLESNALCLFFPKNHSLWLMLFSCL